MRKTLRFGLAALAILWSSSLSGAQDENTGKDYPDGHGGSVHFPLGGISFADEVVAYKAGNPDGGKASLRPDETLGIPNYAAARDNGYLTLGCGGVLTAAFSDNALIDVPGPDLYVFEIGPQVEPTVLSISVDGAQWTNVGMISGGKAEVDIADFVASGGVFRFVRLTDLQTACEEFAGADIDAIGTIGAAAKISLDSAVLFDTGKHELKAAAILELDKALGQIGKVDGTRILVEGHTDDVGSDASNQLLSERRAAAVAAYLVSAGGFAPEAAENKGYGESQPVAANDTDQGRARNRRVEIVIRSQPAMPVEAGEARKKIVGVWKSSLGLMQLTQTSSDVEGVYGGDGRINGSFVDAKLFEGHWVEEKATQECPAERLGSRFWGRVRFQFDDEALSGFKATWNRCDAEPSEGGWNGKRLF